MQRFPFLMAIAALSLAACRPTLPPDAEPLPHLVTIAWSLEGAQTDDTDRTTHELVFVITDPSMPDPTRIPLGRFAGCAAPAIPADGPLLTLSCWFAGAGDDFQVRMEGTQSLVIDHRTIEEGQDIPSFTPLRTIPVEEGATIIPLVEGRE